jgi:hypothetical protein
MIQVLAAGDRAGIGCGTCQIQCCIRRVTLLTPIRSASSAPPKFTSVA